MTEDEMVGWCHRLYGHEFEQALGVSGGQGSLARESNDTPLQYSCLENPMGGGA